MATNHYRVRMGATATNNGRDLIDAMAQLSDAYSRITRLFDAMTQAKDGTAGNATDYVTPAEIFGIVDDADALSSTVAMALYAEVNSLIGTAGAALEQAAARLKQ